MTESSKRHVRWDEINNKIEEAVKMIQEDGLTMVSATFGVEPINNWQYKIWIPKSKLKKSKKRLGDNVND